MDLYFTCPVQHRPFASASWEVLGELRVEEGESGQRRLKGTIRVLCPYCRGMHVFSPDAVACSVSFGAAVQPEGGKQ